jgi:hypothetical protein
MTVQSELRTLLGANGGRRGLLRGAGMGAAAFGAIAAGMTGSAEAEEEPSKVPDVDILNFALNLEYLEAEFYLRAVTGSGLPPGDTGGQGTQGTVTGGRKVNFKNPMLAELAAEIANDEFNHVQYLRAGLGVAAVAEPSIDLSTSFTTLGLAAGFLRGNETFDPFSGDEAFLVGAFIFEDVGVTAYHGAASLIKSKAYLEAAAGILAVEAYHASEIRLQLLQASDISRPAKIAHLRALLSGVPDDQGIYTHGTANIVPTTKNSIAFKRNTSQVLNIVYGGGSGSNYLFYPNMMNGAIH